VLIPGRTDPLGKHPAATVLSSDYDKSDQATQVFFATVQNVLLYAVTQRTAAELITARASPDDRHFGLLNWQGARVRKQDILVAKNYLTEAWAVEMTSFSVVYDACVLYPAPLRDLSMHLAKTDLYRGKWTQQIHAE
jgi:hypothetical protein